MRALDDGVQNAVLFHADAARNMTVFGQRVLEMVADHRPVRLFSVCRLLQKCTDLRKRFGTVEIVRIDHHKRCVDMPARREHRVSRAPRLYAPFRNRKACRKILKPLKRVFNRHVLRNAVAHDRAEIRVQLFLDDKNHLREAGAHCVKHREIHDDLAVFPDGIDLLQAAVTAAHAGRHNDQNRFLHDKNHLFLTLLSILLRRRPKSAKAAGRAAPRICRKHPFIPQPYPHR